VDEGESPLNRVGNIAGIGSWLRIAWRTLVSFMNRLAQSSFSWYPGWVPKPHTTSPGEQKAQLMWLVNIVPTPP